MLVPPSGDPSAGDADRDAVVARLRDLVGTGALCLERFEELTQAAYAAASRGQLANIVRELPAPVTRTPLDRVLDRPLEVDVGHGQVRLVERWQLAERTTIRVSYGQAIVDLGAAEWDQLTVHLELVVGLGQIVVRVPEGVEVRFERRSANVVDRLSPQPALPGAPQLLLTTDTRQGRIVLQRTDPSGPTRRPRWWRRRGP